LGGARLWAELLGYLERKPKDQLRFVDSTFIKGHQAGKDTIGGSKNHVIGLKKGGHNSEFVAAFDRRERVVALLLFPGQCAETTAAKQLPPIYTSLRQIFGFCKI
jgi:hypothetical protein